MDILLDLININPVHLLATLLAVALGMTVHELAHSWVADRLGDPLPRNEGRLTLSPGPHIHWLGALMFTILGFGIQNGAPVSLDPKGQRRAFLMIVAAGPLSNLLVAGLFALAFQILAPQPGITASVLNQIIYFNLLLAVLNVIPLYPLDGWHIVRVAFPPNLTLAWQRHQQFSCYLLIAFIIASAALDLPLLDLDRLAGTPTRTLFFRLTRL